MREGGVIDGFGSKSLCLGWPWMAFDLPLLSGMPGDIRAMSFCHVRFSWHFEKLSMSIHKEGKDAIRGQSRQVPHAAAKIHPFRVLNGYIYIYFKAYA